MAVPFRGSNEIRGVLNAGTIDEFHQQSPRCEKVRPPITGDSGTVLTDLFAITQDTHSWYATQMSYRFVDVIDDEAQVMAATVAVPGVLGSSVCGLPLKELDVEVRRQSQHHELQSGV
jgi:hypothetical protein